MSGRSGAKVGRWIILIVAAVYFFGPFLAAIWFTVHVNGGISFDAYRQIFQANGVGEPTFGASLTFSVLLSVATMIFTLGLMVPTQVLLRLRFPRTRSLVEVLCLLPLVFPPVVLVVGVQSIYGAAEPPQGSEKGSWLFHGLVWIKDANHPALLMLLYSVMTLPYVYRTLDAGLRSIDVGVLTEASRSLGAGWGRTILSVVMASMRTSIVNAGFLIFALVMGEFTVASILLYTKPFSVWLVELPTNSGQVQAAVSVLALMLVELVLVVITLGSSASRLRGRTSEPDTVTELFEGAHP